MIMHTHSNKKTILYFIIILLIFLFTLNGNKIYAIKYDDLEDKNSQILKSENINNYILDDKKESNYSVVYAYRLDNNKEYVFIYSKSSIFNLYHLDDKFISNEDEINTLASNSKYHNLLKIDRYKDKAIISLTPKKNKDFISNIIYALLLLALIILISYQIQIKQTKRKS